MRDDPASQFIRQAAVAGDRARRVHDASHVLVRWLPIASVTAAVFALLLTFFGGPRIVGPAILTGACAAAAVLSWLARRRRTVSDQDVRDIDRAAGVGGLLRSAHWFATAAESSMGSVGEFHLEDAASKLAGIDWSRVYPQIPVRSAWAKTAAGVAATLAAFLWPTSPATLPARSAGGSVTDVREAAGNGTLPTALVPKLVEGVEAFQSGRTPSREALTAIGQALELSAGDNEVQRQLDDVLAASRAGDVSAGFWSEPEECVNGDLRGCEEARQRLNQAALQWAYEDALARAKIADAQDAARPRPSVTGAESGSATPSQSSDSSRAPIQPGAQSGDTPDGQPLLSNTQGEATSFSSLLFGRQASSTGDGRQSGAGQLRSTSLSTTLRSEVVHAAADTIGPNTPRSEPRRATSANAAGGSVGVRTITAYDRGASWQPPAVPEVRKRLVHDFFRRVADPEPPASKP